MIVVKAENVRLAMVSSVKLPASSQNTVTKKWERNGLQDEFTEYIFLTDMDEKITLLAKDGQYKEHVGKTGALNVKLDYNAFDRKWKVGLYGFVPDPEKGKKA